MNVIQRDMNRFIELVKRNKNRFQTVAANEVKDRLKRRVFNNGKAASGESIGSYKNLSYREYRKKRGRQVQYVDLQLEGDLFNSVQTGRSGNDVVLGITKNEQADIAAKNEQRYGKAIFKASESEEKAARDVFLEELHIVAREAFAR